MFVKCKAWAVKKEDMDMVDQILRGKGFMTDNDDKTLITSGMSTSSLTEEEESRIFSIPRCKLASVIWGKDCH